MIPTFELEQHLIDILRNTKSINENSVIEYKAVPHSKDFDTELFKDVLGLANSYERPNEDRWLIYGVNNKTCDLVCIYQNNPDLLDGADYQEKFEKIHPHLHIEFVKTSARSVSESFEEGMVFAAFYIPKECMNEIYELRQTVSDKQMKKGKLREFHPGTSFIRLESSAKPLLDHHRAEKKKLARGYVAQPLPLIELHESTELLTKSADIFLLLGSWDEANEADRELLSAASGEPYSRAIKKLQSMLDDGFSAWMNRVGLLRIELRESEELECT